MGASRGAICPFCRFTIARLDDGTLAHAGKIADLVPTNPPFHVGDRGTLNGAGFTVIGRQQLDHGAGPWDELYIVADTGDARWLALAQGRWFLTSPSPVPSEALPPVAGLGIGVPIPGGALIGLTAFERGRYRVLSAEGELPMPIQSGETGAYADLEGPNGRFATLDDDGAVRRLYDGVRLDGSAVVRTSRGDAAAMAEVARVPEAKKLACRVCGGPLSLTLPNATERIGCPSCGSLLDAAGGVISAATAQDAQRRVRTRIPIGSEGVLLDQRCRVVGYLSKSCVVEGFRYFWDEYLLATEHGYLWLTEENGHCSVYRDAHRGNVLELGATLVYEDTKFHLFSNVEARVEAIVGELTYAVELGERTHVQEFIAPPHSISREQTPNERSYSYGTYVPTKDVYAAFGVPERAPAPQGVGTLQPVPLAKFGRTTLALCALLAFAECSIAAMKPGETLATAPLVLPMSGFSSGGSFEPPAVTLVDDIIVPRTSVVEVQLHAPQLSNAWIETEMMLVSRDDGQIYEMTATAEQYSGYSGGESWSEGDNAPTSSISRVPPGRYLLRVVSAWDGWPSTHPPFASLDAPPPTVTVSTEGAGSTCCFCTGLLLLIPGIVVFIYRLNFKQRRWSESNVSENGSV